MEIPAQQVAGQFLPLTCITRRHSTIDWQGPELCSPDLPGDQSGDDALMTAVNPYEPGYKLLPLNVLSMQCIFTLKQVHAKFSLSGLSCQFSICKFFLPDILCQHLQFNIHKWQIMRQSGTYSLECDTALEISKRDNWFPILHIFFFFSVISLFFLSFFF